MRSRSRGLGYTGLSIVGLVLTASTYGSSLFTISADPTLAPTSFQSIDTVATSFSNISNLGVAGDGFSGLAFRPGNDVFYTIQNPFTNSSTLSNFLPDGSGLAAVGSLDPGFTGGLAYDSANDTLYAISNDISGNSILNMINPLTGAVSGTTFNLGTGFVGGITYDSLSDTLYAIQNDDLGNSTLVTIDPATGAIGGTTFAIGQGFTGGVAFDASGNQLYAISSDLFGNSSLNSITTAGVATNLFDVNPGTVNAALTFETGSSDAPEPGTAVVVGASLMAIGLFRKLYTRKR